MESGKYLFEDAVRILNNVARCRGGIRPGFNRYHAYLALTLLSNGKPVGRKVLSRVLGIGEGSVRTLIRRLREVGLVRVDPVAGILITDLGTKVVDALGSRLVIIGSVDLSFSDICSECRISTILLKDGVNVVKRVGVLYVRDLIVKNGGNGGLIIYYLDNEFKLPNSKHLYVVEDPSLWYDLLSQRGIDIHGGDCLISAICRKNDDNCLMYVVEAILEILEVYND